MHKGRSSSVWMMPLRAVSTRLPGVLRSETIESARAFPQNSLSRRRLSGHPQPA